MEHIELRHFTLMVRVFSALYVVKTAVSYLPAGTICGGVLWCAAPGMRSMLRSTCSLVLNNLVIVAIVLWLAGGWTGPGSSGPGSSLQTSLLFSPLPLILLGSLAVLTRGKRIWFGHTFVEIPWASSESSE